MLLHHVIINSSIPLCLYSGVVWCSLVYYIINNSKHYITSITPLYQHFYIVHEAKKEINIFTLIYVVYLDFWCSGVTTTKSSLLCLKMHYTELHQATPEMGADYGLFIIVPGGIGLCL